jgi:hypothetical protein
MTRNGTGIPKDPRHQPPRIVQHPSTTTGLQVAHAGTVRQLEAWRDQLSPREYSTLIALLGRWIDAERDRLKFSLRRWAA